MTKPLFTRNMALKTRITNDFNAVDISETLKAFYLNWKEKNPFLIIFNVIKTP